MRHGVPLAAWQRFDQLQQEEEMLRRGFAGQEGTSIPKLFYQNDSFVVNPSAVGTGILARMIETDDAVSSAVQFKILMILSKIGEYHHPNPKITEFVNGFLKRMKGPTWAEALEAMLSSKAFGFSLTEIIFDIDEFLQKIPTRLCTYHPSTIAFECDEAGQITPDGVLQFVLQTNQYSNPNGRFFGIQHGDRAKNPFTTPTDRLLPYRVPFLYQYGLARIPRKKVIHMTNLPMFSFGSPYGKTEVRTAHLAWQLKQFILKQMGITSKRGADGFLWATAPHGTDNVEVKLPDGTKIKKSPVQAMTDLLANRENSDSVVTGPETAGYKLTSMQLSGNLDQMINAINNLDVRIFRCFLLPSLVMTDGSAGNRALGDKHFQIVDRVAESESTKCGQTIVNDLIEDVIRANFGKQSDKDGYGAFQPRPQSIEERERLANIFNSLSIGGWMKPHVKEDMAFVRQSLSVPPDADKSMDLDDDESHRDQPPKKDEGGEDEIPREREQEFRMLAQMVIDGKLSIDEILGKAK